eukprot:11200748-Lingulodinium_polyedra.AAC.1
MSAAVPHRDCITLHTCCDGRQVCINTITEEVYWLQGGTWSLRFTASGWGVLEKEGQEKLMVKNIMTRSAGKAQHDGNMQVYVHFKEENITKWHGEWAKEFTTKSFTISLASMHKSADFAVPPLVASMQLNI